MSAQPFIITRPYYRDDLSKDEAALLGIKLNGIDGPDAIRRRYAAGDAELHLRRWLVKDRAENPDKWNTPELINITVDRIGRDNLQLIANNPATFKLTWTRTGERTTTQLTRNGDTYEITQTTRAI